MTCKAKNLKAVTKVVRMIVGIALPGGGSRNLRLRHAGNASNVQQQLALGELNAVAAAVRSYVDMEVEKKRRKNKASMRNRRLGSSLRVLTSSQPGPS